MSEDWRVALRQSEYFLAIGTKSYLEDLRNADGEEKNGDSNQKKV